jgi:hypothetical protein
MVHGRLKKLLTDTVGLSHHHALTILKTKKSATESPKVFEGEHEYRAWLKSKGMIEVDNDAYVSQTGLRKNFSSMD